MAPDTPLPNTHPVPSALPADADLEAAKDLRPVPTRASLPHSRPGSLASHGHADRPHSVASGASEYAWGPSHPCFPHPNPHVPLNSPLYDSTRIIRITRDWMVKGDLAPTFANLYPEILEPWIHEDDFRAIIKHINDSVTDAFDPLSLRAWLDSLMGIATLWLWEDAGFTKVKKKLAALERWIERWNRDHGEKEGVRIIPLRRTGYLSLDIQIPDPHFENVTASRPDTHQDDLDGNAAGKRLESKPGAHDTPSLQVNSGFPKPMDTY